MFLAKGQTTAWYIL